jgi:transposase
MGAARAHNAEAVRALDASARAFARARAELRRACELDGSAVTYARAAKRLGVGVHTVKAWIDRERVA